MCCIENCTQYIRHIKPVDLRFAAMCILAQCINNLFFSCFVHACASFRCCCVLLMHLRFAYFKAIIVFILNVLKFFSFCSFYSLLRARILFISFASECSFFSLAKTKSWKKRHTHLIEQPHGYSRVHLYLYVVPMSVCECAFAFSFTPFTLLPLFLRLSLKLSK